MLYAVAALLPSISAYQLPSARGPRCGAPVASRAALLLQAMPESPKIDSADTYNVMMRTLMETENNIATEIQEAVNSEMAARMQSAMATLKEIIQSPTAIIMEGKVAGLARQGKIDDALMTMLEANLQQAEQAGEAGAGAVQVLGKLKERVRSELDTKVSPT